MTTLQVLQMIAALYEARTAIRHLPPDDTRNVAMRNVQSVIDTLSAKTLMVVRFKQDFKHAGQTHSCVQTWRRYKITAKQIAWNQPRFKEDGKLFVNDMLFTRKDYVICRGKK